MKLTLTAAFAVIVGLAFASATPEEEGRKHRGHPGIKQLIEKFDKDGDGKISPEEKKAIAEEMKKRFGDRRRPGGHKPRPEGGKPEGRRPRPEGGKPEGRKPRPDRKPGKRPAKKK